MKKASIPPKPGKPSMPASKPKAKDEVPKNDPAVGGGAPVASSESAPPAPVAAVMFKMDNEGGGVMRVEGSEELYVGHYADGNFEFVTPAVEKAFKDEFFAYYQANFTEFTLNGKAIVFGTYSVGEEIKVPPLPERKHSETQFREDPDIPPPPKQNKRDGDKTPAYVDWLKQYHPEEFARRFNILGPGQVTKYKVEEEPITGRKRHIPYKADALLSNRKTHLTEKPDAKADDQEEAVHTVLENKRDQI